MPIEILQKMGLSPNEAKIYEALLDLNEANVGEISSKTEIHRRNVYDTLKRLSDKGLVFPILEKKENFYAPVDPDKLLELLKEKESELEKVLPIFRERYKNRVSSQEAYIYRGIEGVKNYMRDILRDTKEVHTIGGKLSWLDEKLTTFSKKFFEEAARKKIKFNILFDSAVAERAKNDIKVFGEGNFRFLPAKYSTDSAIDIFNDYVVTFTGMRLKQIDVDITVFILKDKKLADSYRKWFQFMWDNLK